MLEPVSRKTLPQAILGKIIDAIKEGVWQPGSRIPGEQELASAFAVSRNSIREAVKILNNMGILHSHPGQGTFLSADAIQQILYLEFIEKGKKDTSLFDLLEIRLLLESQCAYWTTKRASDDELAEFENILKRSRATDTSDLERQNALHQDFHTAIIRLSKNSFVIRLFSLIEAEIESQRSKYDAMPNVVQVDMIHDQETIAAHVLAREAEKARLAMEKHLHKGLRFLAQTDESGTLPPD